MDASLGQLLSLDGKTALVTGGATGIGEGIARLLAAAGACVVIGDIDDQGAAAVAAGITEEGHRADALHLDVTDPESADAAVARTRTVGGSFDILVNNAGSYHEAGSIIDQTWESWKRAVDINYVSVFACSKPAAQTMASATFDLPEPFGPTTTATPGSRLTSTASGNDLKPRSLIERRCTGGEYRDLGGRPATRLSEPEHRL